MDNLYVARMDRFSESLQHLSQAFLQLETKNDTLTQAQMEDLFLGIHDKVCQNCEKYKWCIGENCILVYQTICEILSAVDEYGTEIPIELKRKLQKKCIRSSGFLKQTLDTYQDMKKVLFWNNKIAQNREGCAIWMDTFAQTIQHAVRELDSEIFIDEIMEKKIKNQLKKIDVYLLDSVFLVTAKGKYEIHLTVRSKKGQCVTTKEVMMKLSSVVGKKMVMENGERPIIGEECCTVTALESPLFYTLQGVAKIGKGCDRISGDNFLMIQLPGGKQGIILSDGMGSGEKAFHESSMAVELLEELLLAGFPEDTAIQMLNTALVMGREEIRFSTIDMSVFDLYTGKCEFIKAGASTTYIKHGQTVEKISSTSLPIGVVQRLDIDIYGRRLKDNDFVIMVTDGVLDALPSEEQDAILETIISGTNIRNPKELSHHILQQVLEWTGEKPADDMTVIAAGIWKFQK